MNQCSPVADHSLREARACHVSVPVLRCQCSAQYFTENGQLRTDNLPEKGRELGGRNSVHRATYCAHNYPLPLLPSGPGGVGGITSRRTRHRNHFITQRSPPPTCTTASVQNLPT